MTILPTRLTATPPTVSWVAGASACADDVVTHRIYLSASPTPTGPFPLRFTVPSAVAGKGVYNIDYRLRSLQGPATLVDTDTYELIVNGRGVSQIMVDINQNNDTSETYEPTIVSNGSFYNLGATLGHVITCTAAAVRPDATNTGLAGAGDPQLTLDNTTVIDTAGDAYFYRKRFVSAINVKRCGGLLRFEQCHFENAFTSNLNRAAVEFKEGPCNEVEFVYCQTGEVGDTTNSPPRLLRGGTILNRLLVDSCKIHYVGFDGCQLWSSEDATIRRCYATNMGFGDGAHADFMQSVGSGSDIIHRRMRIEECNWDWSIDAAEAAGWGSNSFWITGPDSQMIDGIAVRCWIRGGNNTFDFKEPSTTNCAVRNCQIGDIEWNGVHGSGATGDYRQHLIQGQNADKWARSGNKSMWQPRGPVNENGLEFNTEIFFQS